MKVFLVVAVGVMLVLSACGASQVHKLSTDPQTRKKEQQAQKIVQGCIAKGNFLTHSGRQRVIQCIAPPGKKVQVERCAQKAIASNGVLTHHQREKSLAAIENCVVMYR